MRPFVSLMYHNVCRQRPVNGIWPGFERLSPSVTSYFVDEETFSRHCRQIDTTQSSETNPDVLITFDDGWLGTLEVAGPILQSCQLTATVFVTTGLIGHPLFLNEQQLASMGSSFEVGAHGRTHQLLAKLNDKQIREELYSSKSRLEDILGKEVPSMAFPGGSFDQRVVETAREVGFRQLHTSQIGLNRDAASDLIRRVAVKAETSDTDFVRYLQGSFRREQLREFAKAFLRRSLGRNGYAAFRSSVLAEEKGAVDMTDLTEENSSVVPLTDQAEVLS